MRPGRQEANRSDKKNDFSRIWEALKAEPPAKLDHVKPTESKAPTSTNTNSG